MCMHIPLASFNLDQQEGRDKTETVTLVSLLTGDGGMKMQQPCNYQAGTGEIPLGPEAYWIQLSLTNCTGKLSLSLSQREDRASTIGNV